MTSRHDNSILADRNIVLLHFHSWFDHSIPYREIDSLNELLKELLTLYISSNGALKAVVHCRGGHGRTGTFLTIFARML